jgi:phosphoglycerate kinase
VYLPVDVVAGDSIDDENPKMVAIEGIGGDAMALDIGPATVENYKKVLSAARTVFWNGPMGVFEKPKYAAGTLAVAKTLADNKLALTVVGGGDSAAAIAQAGLADKVSHVSTGGGASLEFIQGLDLPGIAALRP